MSKHKFTATERQAIWLAHDKKCAYTRELLDLKNMHIDHIIHESMANDPLSLAELRKELGLAEDFNINGFENLLPCTQGINLQKSDFVFDKTKTLYFLQIAASKVDRIRANLNKLKIQLNKAKAVLFFQGLIEEGKISIEEVTTILESYSSKSGDVFELIEGLSFVDKAEVTTIRKSEISELRTRPIFFGSHTDDEGLLLQNDEGEYLDVRTCLEYDEAISDGFFAFSTVGIKMSAYFEHQCGLLKALENAQIPDNSYVSTPRVGVIDLHLMPYDLFFEFEKDGTNGTYQDKVTEGVLKVKRLQSNLLVIESETMGQQLIEVARADFNGDGIEDIFCFEYIYAIGGTFGVGNIKILTRLSASAQLQAI